MESKLRSELSFLDRAQTFMMQRFLSSDNVNGLWYVDYDLYVWAKEGGYPNLAAVTWPG